MEILQFPADFLRLSVELLGHLHRLLETIPEFLVILFEILIPCLLLELQSLFRNIPKFIFTRLFDGEFESLTSVLWKCSFEA